MQKIDQILDIIKTKGLNIQQVARNSGISSSRIYKWLDGKGRPKSEDSRLLTEWAAKYLEEKIENVPREQQKSTSTSDAEKAMQIIADLVSSNRTLVQANAQLVTNNTEVIEMLKVSLGETGEVSAFLQEEHSLKRHGIEYGSSGKTGKRSPARHGKQKGTSKESGSQNS